MARAIYPQWPAQPPEGTPLQDEIDRRVLRSFMDIASATPEEVAEYHKQEAIRAQDAKAREDEYQRGAAESAKINEAESRRQAYEEMKQYQDERRQEDIDKLHQRMAVEHDPRNSSVDLEKDVAKAVEEEGIQVWADSMGVSVNDLRDLYGEITAGRKTVSEVQKIMALRRQQKEIREQLRILQNPISDDDI